MQLKQYLVAFTLASSSVLALPTEVQGGACVRGLDQSASCLKARAVVRDVDIQACARNLDQSASCLKVRAVARDVDIQACARDLNTDQSKSCLKIREAYVASVAKDYGPDY